VALTEVITTYQNIILEFMPPIYLRSVFLIYEFMAIKLFPRTAFAISYRF
jgi:hypothetical protein